jgi:hypothetical protein
MLLKFKFKNFKSFRDEVCLDLTATKITEFSDRNFEVGNIKVLPVASIFGANASGKSNVMDAFRFMCEYIIMSLNFAGGQVNPLLQGGTIKPTPFLFDSKSRDEGSKFEVYFVMNNDKTEKIYQYGFVFNNSIIEEEWLYYKAKTSREDFKNIFYRSKDENNYDGLEKDKIKNIEVSMQKETLVLTLGSKLKERTLSDIYNWFMQIMNINFGNVAENLFISQMYGILQHMLNENIQKNVVKYLSTFDESIVGMDAQESLIDPITKKKTIEINFHHKMIDTGKAMRLPMIMESAGTQKMFNLYPYFNNAILNGCLLFIDELNARLHPLLIRTIVQMFLDKDINKNKAQLIFTSHDVWQLKSDIMRRDEIWFTEKNDKGISNLYSLSDFIDEDGVKVRKDEDYQKNYILGKYGAIPNLKGFEGVFD